MDEVVRTALKFLGLPQTSNFEKKIVLGGSGASIIHDLQQELQMSLAVSKIKDVVFVREENHIEFYRQRKLNGVPFFSRCEKRLEREVYHERKKQVPMREFYLMESLPSEQKFILRKSRVSFMFKKRFFIIDISQIEGVEVSICIVQGAGLAEEIELPTAVQKRVVREVPKNYVGLMVEMSNIANP